MGGGDSAELRVVGQHDAALGAVDECKIGSCLDVAVGSETVHAVERRDPEERDSAR